jgi:hypothetical protein
VAAAALSLFLQRDDGEDVGSGEIKVGSQNSTGILTDILLFPSGEIKVDRPSVLENAPVGAAIK